MTGRDPTPTPTWANSTYNHRMRVDVSTGSVAPSGGYNGYTARLTNLDTATLVSNNKLQADCDDLRAYRHNAGVWTELDRHILGCNGTQTEVRFRLQADIGTSSIDGGYFLYYGNSGAGAGPADLNKVYLWFDSGGTDQLS